MRENPLLTLIGAVVIAVVGILIYFCVIWFWSDSNSKVCRRDFLTEMVHCRPQCQHGFFMLSGMEKCHQWLGCKDAGSITIREVIGHGAVKMVKKGYWHGYEIAVSTLNNLRFEEDFIHGLNMIKTFQPTEEVVQLVGSCGMSYFTEFYPLGSANNLLTWLQSVSFQKHDSLRVRFRVCLSYVKAILFLHTSPSGTRVMCDSNDPNKTLSQFLINSDLDLVLNDLDALPEVSPGKSIKCGHKELDGDYVAPEQLWPYEDEDFIDSKMPGYDEKSDIWKIPDVCNLLLGKEGNLLRMHLFEIHSKCKEEEPSLRPSAAEVYHVYKKTLDMINKINDDQISEVNY